jgi:hypothetical protein
VFDELRGHPYLTTREYMERGPAQVRGLAEKFEEMFLPTTVHQNQAYSAPSALS